MFDKNKIKKILITGGTGFIGKCVVDLLKRDYAVRVFSRRNISVDGFEVFVGDLTNELDVAKAIEGVDCIVHLAAMISGKERDIYSFNTKSTEILVNLAIKNKLSKFIFISSDTVLLEGQSAYGESKKKCEEIVGRIKNSVIFRSTLVYGQGDYSNLGRILSFARKHKFVFIPGSGNCFMQPIFVDDVAKYIFNSLKYGISGTFVLAGCDKINLNNFIDEASRVIKVKFFKVHIPLLFLNPFVKILGYVMNNPPIKLSQIKNLNRNRIYDISKTCKILKHTPLSLKEGLEKTFSHHV